MSGWGIAETAPVIEKIKAESADYLRGLNSCGDIAWSVYDKAFDFYMELISRAYEQGKKDAHPAYQWISVEERLPEEVGVYAVTVHVWENAKKPVGVMTSATNWNGTDWLMYDADDVIAWMPLPVPPEI